MHSDVHLLKEVTVTLMRNSGYVQGFLLFPDKLDSDFIHISTWKRRKGERKLKKTKQQRADLNPKNAFGAHISITYTVSGQRQLTPAADCLMCYKCCVCVY